MQSTLSSALVMVIATAGMTVVVNLAEATPRRDFAAMKPNVKLLTPQLQAVESESDLSVVQTQLGPTPYIQLADVSPTATMPMIKATTRWSYDDPMRFTENTKATAGKHSSNTGNQVQPPPTNGATGQQKNSSRVENST